MSSRTVVQIRLKPEEKERLERIALESGMDMSKLIKHRVLGGPDSSDTGSGVERAAVSCGGVSPPVEFRCPQSACGFVAGSGSARCPTHGRRVVAG